MAPLVSFIVVNWNGEPYLRDCLRSIFHQTYHPFEVIVVDNGSADGSKDILQEFPEAKVLFNSANLGFGPANNQGVAVAAGEAIAFVNNDTILQPEWLEKIVQPLLERNDIGMCAGKILSQRNPDFIDNTGHLLYWDGLNRGRGRMQKDEGQFDSAGEALFPSGCCSLFRAEMLKQIGCFDEDFYLYGDDAELGIRARLAGWQCAFVPDAVAYHYGSASTSYYHPMKFFFVERNRLWVALKYFPLELVILNPFFSSLRYLFHAIAALKGSGVTGEFRKTFDTWALIRLCVQAQVAGWGAAPRFFKKRRDLRRKYGWNRRAFYRCFLPHRLGLKELAFTP